MSQNTQPYESVAHEASDQRVNVTNVHTPNTLVSVYCAPPSDECDGESDNRTFVVNVHGCSAKKFLVQIVETLKRHQHIVKDAALAMEREHRDLEVMIDPQLPFPSPGQRSGTYLTPLFCYAKYQAEALVDDETLTSSRPSSETTNAGRFSGFKRVDTTSFDPLSSQVTRYRLSWHAWNDSWRLMDALMDFIMLPKSGGYTPLSDKELFHMLAHYAQEKFGTVTRNTLYRAAWNILLGHIKGLLIDIALFARLRIVFNLHLPRLHLRDAGTRNINAFIENFHLDLNRYYQLDDYHLDGYNGETVLVKRARYPSQCCTQGFYAGVERMADLSSLNIVIPDSSYLDSLLQRVIAPLNLIVDNASTRLTGLALRVYEIIDERGLTHTSDLQCNVRVSRSTIHRIINQLLSMNMIRRVEHGLYTTMTEEEREVSEEDTEKEPQTRRKTNHTHHDYPDEGACVALDALLSELQFLSLGGMSDVQPN